MLKTLVEKMTLKGALAFVLILLSFVLVYTWMNYPPNSADGNMIALLAGFVTLFLTMTKDAVGYNFTSSASQERQQQTAQDTASKAIDALAASAPLVPSPPPVSPAPNVVVAWWSLFTSPEQEAMIAASADPRVQSIIDASKVGKASSDDLAYLVSKNLLTQERQTAIQVV
jgi:hypothetical protein